jgi:N-acetylglucosamine-6-phosphate deacetylase
MSKARPKVSAKRIIYRIHGTKSFIPTMLTLNVGQIIYLMEKYHELKTREENGKV